MPFSAETLPITLHLGNLYVALASPLIGSAIAAGTARRVGGQAWGLAPSRCPACGRRLGALEMVPIASWVALGGKCRGCSAPISRHYPLVELAAVAVAAWGWLATPPGVFVATCVFGWLLVALAAVDLRTRRLPDGLNLALALSGLGVAAWLDGGRFLDHVAGCALGYASLVAIGFMYLRIRGRDGIGRGDAKMLAGIGAWIGIQGLAVCIFVAAGAGIAFLVASAGVQRRRISSESAIAFGPFLAVGAWLTWIWGPLGV